MPTDWYETVAADAPLMQGDFVLDCPSLTPPTTLTEAQAGRVAVERTWRNAVIMTQSCDLYSKGADTVLLCPYYSFREWIQRTGNYTQLAAQGQPVRKHVTQVLADLASGRRVAYHLLDRVKQPSGEDYQVVELNAAFSVHRPLVEQLVRQSPPRIRLTSPYREHLSQAYARVFMRVGLPQNIETSTDLTLYDPDAAFVAVAKARVEAERRAKESGQTPS